MNKYVRIDFWHHINNGTISSMHDVYIWLDENIIHNYEVKICDDYCELFVKFSNIKDQEKYISKWWIGEPMCSISDTCYYE